MMNFSLFLIFLTFFQINKLGLCIRPAIDNTAFVDVTSFGAVGDGKTDDSKAFLKAWEAVCGEGKGNGKLRIPKGKDFMLQPLEFVGPCMPKIVSVEINGNLLAPKYRWDIKKNEVWIGFDNIVGLTVSGGGVIDGRGSIWWGLCSSKQTCGDRPTAMHFHKCDGLKLSGLHHVDSPKNHISINDSENVEVFELNITAPAESPNTDGIDISDSKGIIIRDSFIGTCEDCVAINTGSFSVTITRVFCGPGHGLSIGSLGTNGEYASVENIKVINCTLTGTDNGVRIKTYQDGSGYARNITFEDIQVVNSKNPVIINQYYINKMGPKDNKKGQGIQVSDVIYNRVFGTSASEEAITLKCNKNLRCKNIVMNTINITSTSPGKQIYSVCNNVDGSFSSVQPATSCS